MPIRIENKNDFDTIETMLKKSFINAVYTDGDEQNVPTDIRGTDAYIKELSLVYEEHGKIIGYIMFSKTYILTYENKKIETILAEPLAVDMDYQSHGIGSNLIKTGLSIAKKLDYKSCFLIGDINYYKKFSFIEANNFSIYTSDEHSNEHLLALELETDALKDIKGCLHLYWAEDCLSDDFKHPHGNDV